MVETKAGQVVQVNPLIQSTRTAYCLTQTKNKVMHSTALCVHHPKNGWSIKNKLLIIMKITAIILLAACMQVSARGYSQITLVEKNVPLQKVFKEIQQQSGYDFLYSLELLEQSGKVSIEVHN